MGSADPGTARLGDPSFGGGGWGGTIGELPKIRGTVFWGTRILLFRVLD